MTSSHTAISQNLTVPLSDLVRARVSESRVAMPVRGAVYARLNHISGIPARSPNSGYSLSRLRAIDTMITRIARMQEQLTPDVSADPVEQQEALIEEAARQIVDSMEQSPAGSAAEEGFLVNMFA
ncbi:MAG: hypothetical protein ACOCYB_03245 [Alkalispirochaeta sp.]